MDSRKIYLDFNATTPIADEVVSCIHNSLADNWGNPSSAHVYGQQARATINTARHQIANMLEAESSDILFTSGGTEANNMIIFGAVQYFKNFQAQTNNQIFEKPHFITTNVEHDSVILPMMHLAKQSIADVTIIEVCCNGSLDIEKLISKIEDRTCFISVMYANNETGVIMPIPELGSRLKDINAEREDKNLIKILLHTDAAQVIGKEIISTKHLEVDYMTIVGHKFYGPRIGCIWAKSPLYPLLYGGGQERALRPGTENTPMIAGLGKAAELVSKNIKSYREHMLTCRIFLEKKLKETFKHRVVINCENSNRLTNTCSVSFVGDGLKGKYVLSKCEYLIAGVGAACHSGECSQVLLNSGVPLELAKNAIRLSVGRDTNLDDLEKVVADLKQAVSAGFA